MGLVTREVCQNIVQRVREWDLKPRNWSKFARDLLVVVCGIRPVVLCDEVNFYRGSWKMVGEFLSCIGEVSGVLVKGLVYKDEDWEFEGDMGMLYLVNLELLKANCSMGPSECWPVYTLVIPGRGFVRLEEGWKITQCLVDIVKRWLDVVDGSDNTVFYSSTVENFNKVAPTLTGWLLEYPVIHAHENNCLPFTSGGAVIPVDSKVVVRCCAENKVASISQPRMAKTKVPQLFSFTIPTDLLSSSEMGEALSMVNGKISERMKQPKDIWGPISVVIEEAEKVAWAV